jgi:hypothetical protein
MFADMMRPAGRIAYMSVKLEHRQHTTVIYSLEENKKEIPMLTKSKLAISAALLLGAASVAQAANDNQSDPNRGFAFGPYGQWMGGGAVNPVMHRSTRPYAYIRHGWPYGYEAFGFVPPGRYVESPW